MKILWFFLLALLTLPAWGKDPEEKQILAKSNSMAPGFVLGDAIRFRAIGESEKTQLSPGQIVGYISTRSGGVYFQRIVGQPGDRVEIRDKKLFVNGKIVTGREVSEPDCKISKMADEVAAGIHFECYEERLGTKRYQVVWEKDFVNVNFGPVKLPPKSYFLLGDNRSQANDSRFTGLVREDAIRAIVLTDQK